MTSLFEFAEVNAMADMQPDLLASGGRGISPLEFFVVDDEERTAREEVDAGEQAPVESASVERARQTQAMIDAARSDAHDEARRECEMRMETRLDAERERVAHLCGEFAMDRQRYFAAAEAQVVKLAIAIASRILTREVQADAMHLTATVRAALARVHDGTTSILRVRASECAQWEALLKSGRDGHVTVMADEHLDRGECVLETAVGRVELGAFTQLAEIERGFGDLLRRQGE